MSQHEIAIALACLAPLAFALVMGWTASAARRVMTGASIDEERAGRPEDDFPGPRRSLHFIRQDASAVFVALSIANGLLAAIAVLLAAIAYRLLW